MSNKHFKFYDPILFNNKQLDKQLDNNNIQYPNNSPLDIVPTTIIIQDTSAATSIYSIFHTMLSIIAIYLSVRCNPKINYTSIVIAIFCPYLYIIYSIIMHNGICPA
jgi:hypothetical protein